MTYQWKLAGLYPVDAQEAGQTLEEIYRRDGELKPAAVVEESRPEDAPLHGCFEWNDEAAAGLYREQQAMQIIRSIVVVEVPKDDGPQQVRAFVHAQKAYHPLTVACSSLDMRQELLQDAYRDMEAFRRKYRALSELAPVFAAMDQIERTRRSVYEQAGQAEQAEL